MNNIAFIGTGIMGAGMVRCLLKAGHRVTVYNRTTAKVQPLLEAGAVQALTPGAAAADADVIIAIVGDDQASKEVWLGSEGVLAGRPKPGTIAVESTTVSLGWEQELYGTVAAAGLRFIDCPVTGGRVGAENGALTLLVGADEADLAEARPVLEAYSQEIIHFGPPGAGTAYKMVVNLMAAAQATALAEGLLLAEKAGLELDKVIRGLSNGAVGSPLVRNHAERMARSDHEHVNFSVRWMHKDAVYALQMAADLGQAMPMSAVAAQVYRLALAKGWGEQNMSAVIEGLR
jgi:3-hydroxyisobutyrate dehydrogenase